MVFAEHRYFGTSLPRGNISHTYPNYRYLILDQVLEDFAHLIKHIRTEMYMHRGESNSEEAEEENDSYEESERRKARPQKPRVSHQESEESEEDEHEAAVITMGAGYGAMLATWMRTKFAHVVVGALASSAPLIQSRYSEFSELVTRSYASVDQRCPRVIRRLWSDINMLLKTASSSQNNVLETMSSIFGLCRTLRLDEVVELKEWLRVVLSRLAVYNYQHASSILKPLPAYPVKVYYTGFKLEFKIYIFDLFLLVNSFN
jgi:lysosomal Pro-X carboxypeptidase